MGVCAFADGATVTATAAMTNTANTKTSLRVIRWPPWPTIYGFDLFCGLHTARQRAGSRLGFSGCRNSKAADPSDHCHHESQLHPGFCYDSRTSVANGETVMMDSKSLATSIAPWLSVRNSARAVEF